MSNQERNAYFLGLLRGLAELMHCTFLGSPKSSEKVSPFVRGPRSQTLIPTDFLKD